MTKEHLSPEQLEREIAHTRAEIDQTLDVIQDRLSPRRIMEQAIYYTRENGGAFAANLGRSVRDNPLPVALLGVGLGWLMLSGGAPSERDDRDEGWEEVPEKYRREGQQGRDKVDRAAEVFEEAGNVVSTAANRSKDKVRVMRDEAQHLAEGISDRAANARTAAADAVHQARNSAIRARESTARFVEENPLAVGALALAVGALLGAVLPSTRRERELMGEQAHQFRNAAARSARKAASAANDVADEARAGAKAALNEKQPRVSEGESGGGTGTDPLKAASSKATATPSEKPQPSKVS